MHACTYSVCLPYTCCRQCALMHYSLIRSTSVAQAEYTVRIRLHNILYAITPGLLPRNGQSLDYGVTMPRSIRIFAYVCSCIQECSRCFLADCTAERCLTQRDLMTGSETCRYVPRDISSHRLLPALPWNKLLPSSPYSIAHKLL